ncbi:lipopolysaccharide biosynthesis protein [Vibrio cholerae]|uniref:lipopolysaccharide biosynthesis protein n=1 Tax=Vibrio cholerae TaxID=666 RepID=UPI0006E6E596|nr:oligosaccharide flippase family protein [Vibrio cholerae]KQA38464.1 polysaccharide biosynthesis protein [Vibrio cholerae]KQA48231.1 polysaccharide biosynthesis protein [Vibrio cholerae]KQA56040.1 polysaccharide biosynthesis protein [Vibrio cholerae]KQA77372.1 polysaccharide biosynthesis protein [Vibrio cholerae]KQA79980.1 polysaccharide biosynthesis protein [Vibrio cholerae]
MKLKKILLFAIGPVGGAILSFISLPIITWFFSQEDVGKMAMLQVTLSFTPLLFCLGLDHAYIREFHEASNKPMLLKAIILPGVLTLSTAISISLLFDGLISHILFDIKSEYLSFLIAIAVFSVLLTRLLSLVLRMNERGLAFSMSQVLPKLLFLLIIGLYIEFNLDKSIDNLVSAHVVSVILVTLLLLWNTRDELLLSVKQKVDFEKLKEMFSYGIPLILSGIAFWGLTATDKIALRLLSNYEQLGLYSVSASFAGAAMVLQSVFATVWSPIVYKWSQQGIAKENVSTVTRYVLCVVCLLFCLTGLFSWLVPYILPDKYKQVEWIVLACMGYPLLYTLSEATYIGIGIARRSSLAMLAALFALVINVIGNVILIPSLGAKGAAISTMVSFFVLLILRTEFSCYVWMSIKRWEIYIFTSLFTISSILSTLIGEEHPTLIRGLWLVLTVLSLFNFKSYVSLAKIRGLKIAR